MALLLLMAAEEEILAYCLVKMTTETASWRCPLACHVAAAMPLAVALTGAWLLLTLSLAVGLVLAGSSDLREHWGWPEETEQGMLRCCSQQQQQQQKRGWAAKIVTMHCLLY